jgi:hypothetical protein
VDLGRELVEDPHGVAAAYEGEREPRPDEPCASGDEDVLRHDRLG